MHLSSIVYELLSAIARYWSEIATFFYPLAFNASAGGVPIGIPGKSLDLSRYLLGVLLYDLDDPMTHPSDPLFQF